MTNIPAHIRKAVYARAGGPYCENIVSAGAGVDGGRCLRLAIGGIHHIIPKSRGGKSTLANLEARCVKCHMELGHGQKVNMEAQLHWSWGRL